MAELTMQQMIQKIVSLKDKHRNEVEVVLPLRIGNKAVNLFTANFDKQGFDTGGGIEAWPQVQRKIPGTKAYKYPLHKQLSRHLSGILIRTGRGRRDVQNSLRSPITGGGIILIPFEVADDYMGYHNEGGPHLPKRKFIGDSQALRDIIEKEIHESFNRIMA